MAAPATSEPAWARPVGSRGAHLAVSLFARRHRGPAGRMARPRRGSPARTHSDVVDRAIALAATQKGEDASWWDQHIDDGLRKLFEPLLAIGGVTLAECDEDASSTAA